MQFTSDAKSAHEFYYPAVLVLCEWERVSDGGGGGGAARTPRSDGKKMPHEA